MFKFHLKPNIQIRIFVGTVALAIIFMLGLTSPAGAIWGESGPGEQLPEFFGVQLGGNVHDYPILIHDDKPLYERDYEIYRFPTDNELTLPNLPVKPAYLKVYQDRIYSIVMWVDYDHDMANLYKIMQRVDEYFSENFGFVSQNLTSAVYGKFEVRIRSSTYITATYLPLAKHIPGESVTFDKPFKYGGVLMGGDASDYDFLIPDHYEGEDVVHFKPIQLELTDEYNQVSSYYFSAYKGKIYQLTLTTERAITGLATYLRDMGLSRGNSLANFFGDLYVSRHWRDQIAVSLTPYCWEAARAIERFKRSQQKSGPLRGPDLR